MAKLQASTKRLAITQANARMIIVVGVASVVSIFCLVGAKALMSQNTYQARVNKEKDKAHVQLQANLTAADDLIESYQKFANSGKNILGGNRVGAGDSDGDNPKIILDALPGSYDFPALASSVEKIITDRHYQITNFTGIDDQINQQQNTTSSTPTAQAIPFAFTVSHANYLAVKDVIDALQLSIRPIQVDSVALSGGSSDMEIVVNAHTYFQPQKSLTIKKQVVK